MGTDYFNTVLPLIKDKSVLDVGSISHTYAHRADYKVWNFEVFKQHARRLRGIDILRDDVLLAARDGYDIEYGDAETYRLGSPVEVVFAGDLIEHLANPGQFLACAHDNLVPGGTLVLVTPNTFSFAKIARVLLRWTNEPPVNAEHTCYFTPRTLEQLVSRFGFVCEQVVYCDFNYARGAGPLVRVQLGINRCLTGLWPRFSQTIVAVFRKKTPPGNGDGAH